PPSNFGPPPLSYSPPPRKSGGDRRKLIIAAAAVGAVVLLVGGITLAVSSGGDDDSAGAATTTQTSETASETPVTTTPKKPGEHAYTIADYIRDNKITETPVHRGDPNTPELTMPTPPGWADAGPRTPAWAYSAIVNDPASPTDPPSVISLISKLDGNVDPDKLLEFAPNELQNLTEWEPIGGVTRSNLSGFPSVQLGGSYLKDGKRRAITQKTVVIEAPSGIYVLQINADSLYRDFGALVDVNKVIDREATIKP
ncbi:LpqN/LpqT family lipoprotein, partial [Mycolicibacterium goodii]|uniref:LpqN/LpqT family lipoprotein n=1 Tax=Mycolicibacterium goodii TaxID=134601 RepID=UPI000CBBB97B